MNGTLARLGFRRQGAIATAVSLLAQAGTIVAVSVLRAIIQAGTNIAAIARPSRVAIAVTLDALSVSTAALAVSRAAGVAVSTAPSVLAGAHTVKALAVSRAAITGLILLPVTMAVLLGTVISSVLLIADTLHLVADGNALSVSTAG
jgi:hypothetical protein